MFVINDSVGAKLGVLFGGDALLVWPFALIGGHLLWRRHTRAIWLSAVAAALTVISLAVDDVPVLWRSSAPTVLSSTMERGVVALVLGPGRRPRGRVAPDAAATPPSVPSVDAFAGGG